jgi:multicomponent Na+:H+ antiporter subunit D
MNILLCAAVLAPILGGAGLLFFPAKTRRGRDSYVLALCSAVSVVVLFLLCTRFMADRPVAQTLLPLMGNGVSLAFRIDGLSAVFAAIVAVLWPITDLYSFEYMSHETHENRFFGWFTITYGVVLGIAFSANLFTMYLFYELLTLCTLPLVMHENDAEARHAGKTYLLYSMSGAAMAFLSLMFLYSFGTLDFVYGGSAADAALAGRGALVRGAFLLGFFGFGVKAAVFPFHRWLPAASVAPTPVTALLHAVAVVNAGLFAVLRLLYYGYGAKVLYGSAAQGIMLGVASFTIVFGSTMALRMQHLKRRLAYSTISNLSYILLAASLCTAGGLAAALAHMVVHSLLKITLFFCAGAILCQTEALPEGRQEYLFQYTGFGRKMPYIFALFTLASVGLIGIPPFAGFFSKWQIATHAAATGLPLAAVGCFALILSAFFTGLYQLEVVLKACCPPDDFDFKPLAALKDPGLCMKISIGLTAGLSILSIFLVNWLTPLLRLAAAGM